MIPLLRTFNETIVFDLDGTLIHSIPHPWVLKVVSETTGVAFETLFERYLAKFTTLEESKKYHLSLAGMDFQKKKICEAYDYFLVNSPKHAPGAERLLKEFKEAGKRMLVWTKGERVSQLLKIEQMGLMDFFNERDILVTPIKTKETVRDLLLPAIGEHRQFIMIGDSWEQDIVPAHKNGALWCFHVTDSPANKYLPSPDTREFGDVIRLETVADLLGNQDNLLTYQEWMKRNAGCRHN
jgi:FMN phosphatase YigB (HAD superfamily)